MTTNRILSSILLLSFSGAAYARDPGAQLAAAQESYRTGDLDGTLQQLEPLIKPDNPKQPANIRALQLAARVLHLRGEEHFRQARIAESITDFDREIQLQPRRAPEHWQRGIAYYYAGDYESGMQQFKVHQTVNPQDVENAAWHFLCVVRSPEGSIETARQSLIPVTRDSRLPMVQIQQMFGGTASPEKVLQTGQEAGGTARFYADLYVGLYYEAIGRNDESLRLITRAAENPVASDSYMGDVARVHVILRKKAGSSTPGPIPKVNE